LAAVLAACAASEARNAVPTAALAENADVIAVAGGRTWADEVPTDVRAEYRRRYPNLGQLAGSAAIVKGRRRVDVLALSGGGADGAFGAGILAGWTERGDRPEFQLVTGVSAGAIIAPFAFLGADYDATLQKLWTEYSDTDLVETHILEGLLGAPALADTKGLAVLLARHVDAALLVKVAAEYRRGRILTIGTTNLDAKRPVVWNMGEIAVQGSPAALELFRNVILASAAVPGLFPPVRVKVAVDGRVHDELHVDGGVTRQVYVAPLNLPFRAFDVLYDRPPDRRLFIIQNSRASPEYDPVKLSALPIAAQSISTLLLSQGKGDVYRIYRNAKDASARFHMLAVPDHFPARPTRRVTIDYQRALYEEGKRLGRLGAEGWLREPPELRPGTPALVDARPRASSAEPPPPRPRGPTTVPPTASTP